MAITNEPQDLYQKLNLSPGIINRLTGEGLIWVKGSPELFLEFARYRSSRKNKDGK